MEEIILGIDVGGSHITSALIDLKKKEEIEGSWFRDRLDSNGSVEEVIGAWSNTILKTMAQHPETVKHIYLAMPGPMDYRKGIFLIKKQDKYGKLYGQNLKPLLSASLGIKTSGIHFINDAACFLKGEVFSGSMSGYDHVIGLTLGTGLGTAEFKNGKAEDAEFWKMPFKKGIAEDYISTRWFISRFYELSGLVIRDVKDLVENHAGSPAFKEVFEEFSFNLASFLHLFIRSKMPLASVIGGNIINADQYFLNDTRKHLTEMMGYSFPVKKSTLLEKAALIGAASTAVKHS